VSGVSKERLLQRLDAIGRSLGGTGHALALIGLGSVGTDLDRIDAYSDIDMFVVVQDGYQAAYIDDLGWLSAVYPIAYCFRNSPHGYKVLFEDGIYAEFAVFSMAELAQSEFEEGRVVWKGASVGDEIRFPRQVPGPQTERPTESLIGEVLTNLYVGLGRYRRGERVSALRFIQGYAVDRILELAPSIEVEQTTKGHPDAFDAVRRFEQRFPTIAEELPNFMQGYDRSPESAAAILAFLELHWEVDAAMREAIVELLPARLGNQ
jgi:lincosamide nucleotidyltransferase